MNQARFCHSRETGGVIQPNREEGAKPGAKEGANFTAQHSEEGKKQGAKEEAARWLSAAQVAGMLGISKRAVQSRCHAGTLSARRVQTPQGEAWEIDAAALGATAKQSAKPGAKFTAKSREAFTVKGGEEGANFAPNEAPAAPLPAAPDRYVSQLETENAFLRAQIEEGNRNAAELRAALREALKAQPRQLEQGNAAPEMPLERLQTGAAPETPPNAQERARTPGNAKEARPFWKLLLGIR